MSSSLSHLALLSLITIATGAGCGRYVVGDGVAAQEARPVTAFSELEVGDGLRAELTIGAGRRVDLSGDANLLPLVRTEVVGDRLIVRTDDWTHLEPRLPLVVKIAAPAVRAIDGSGAAEITGAGVTGPALSLSASGGARLTLAAVRVDRLDIDGSGAARVEIAGQGGALVADLSGASSLLAKDLASSDVQVNASGASRGEVCASRALSADLSGASFLAYYCGPARVEKDLSGASSLEAR